MTEVEKLIWAAEFVQCRRAELQHLEVPEYIPQSKRGSWLGDERLSIARRASRSAYEAVMDSREIWTASPADKPGDVELMAFKGIDGV